LNKIDKSGGGDDGGAPASVVAYEEFQKQHVSKFLNTVGMFPPLKQVGEWTKTAFDFQGTAIAATTVSAKPTDDAFQTFLAPIIGVIKASEKADNKSEFFNHQKAFNEAIQALGWLMQPGPKQVIIAQLEASDLYLNKILIAAKNKTGDEQANHRAFVANLKGMLTALAEYADDNFKMGLIWKTGGAPLANFKPGQKLGGGGGGDTKSNTIDGRLEAIAARLEKVALKSGKSGDDGGKPAGVTAYEEFQKEQVEKFLKTLNAFPQLKPLADWTKTAFDFQGKVIAATYVSAKPTDDQFQSYLSPIINVIKASEKADNKSEFFNHQKAFNEAIQALGWLMQPGPKQAITAQSEAADLYLNKILIAAKNKTGDDQANQRAFVADLKSLLTALAEYAHEHFKMGLTWKAGNGNEKPIVNSNVD